VYTDSELVSLAQKGDKKALDSLIARYQIKTKRLVCRYVDCHFEALDICQEIYIKMVRALPNFRGQSSFFTWYYAIGLNTVKNYLKKNQRHLNHLISIEGLNSELSLFALKEKQTPEQLVMGDEATEILINTLNNMPSCLCHSMLLCDVKGLSYDEIAKTMGCPIGTVRSRIYRARHLVEKKIAG
jgi:RNA polymerase sigma-70 factor (ECF subfamily)